MGPRTTSTSDREPAKSGRGHPSWWTRVRAGLLAGAVAASSVLGTAVIQQVSRAAAAPAMGPINPDTNFPAWYQDTNGTRLELCLDGTPNCLAAATDLVAPGGEAFYFNANTTLPTPAGKSLLVLGTEAAFAAAGAGQESAFNRTRIRINTSSPGDFTVTWPYGKKTYHVDAVDAFKFEINETIDLGCIAAPPDNTCNDSVAPNFSDVAGSLQPFLKWDPTDTRGTLPPGFIGDAATPHRVVGSPNNTNYFRVDGPDIGGPGINTIQTTDFVVQGKVAGPLVSDPAQLSFGTLQVGKAGQLTATLKNIGPASLTIDKNNTRVDPLSPNASDFRVTGTNCGSLGIDVTCTVTAEFKPSTTGAREATLLVPFTTTGGLQTRSPLHLNLTGFGQGVGTASGASVGPQSLSFGTVHVGAESAAQTVTVTSNGTAPLNISKIALSGTNATEFRFASVGCQPKGGLLPGESCQMSVAFSPVHGGGESANLVITDDAAAGSPHTVALAGAGDPGLVGFGPVDPTTHYPAWYEDKTGLKMTPCLDGVPPCFTTAADLVPPGGEGFYMGADALMDTPNGGKARLVLSTEAAYAGSGTGQEITFNRIRFLVTAGLRAGGQYTVTHPYGVDTYIADSSGTVQRKNATQDIGCLIAPCEPNGWAVLEQSRVGPFLRWDPAQAPTPPLGYVSDGATLHKVVGSPYNTNIFRVEGPGINPNPTVDACPTLPAAAKDLTKNPDYSPANCIETDQFTLQGKILPPGPVTFGPAAGGYSTPQQVSLSTQPVMTPAGAITDDSGVKIYYTTDGSEPGLNSTPYSAPFTVSTTTTIKAMAINASGGVSRGTGTYTLGLAPVTVTANPKGGTYAGSQLVSLSPSDPAASIYYTEDGSVPTPSSTAYVPGSSINVASSKTLKFIGVLGGGQPQVFSETYTIANDKSGVSSVLGSDGFPTWYQDTTGLRLEPCYDPSLCFAVLPNPNQPLSFPSNYPQEVFYFGSKALLPSVGNGGKGDLVLSTEAAFLPGPNAAQGQQVTFNRIRVKASGLVPGETYTVKHPYGTETLTANNLGAILMTEDVGCGATPCDFKAALAGRVTPWLTWTGPKPAGYIGGGAAAAGTVTGSPVGFNKFRIEGLNAGGTGVNFIETDQFTVQGKIAGPSVVANPRGGSYATPQTVALTSDDPNAKIYYTTDGKTTPSATDTSGVTKLYSAPISVGVTTTLKAIAVNAAGTSSAVTSEVYTIDTVAPTVTASPTGAQFEASGSLLPVSVSLTSTKLGTMYYTVDGKTTPSPTDTSGVTKVYSGPIGISTSTTLMFLAVDTSGNKSAVGTEIYATVPPAAPTNLIATAGDGQVKLSWTASARATSYNVMRSATAGGPYAAVSTPGAVTSTTFTNTGLTNGATYFYVVTAVNSVGESSASSEASASPQAPAPLAPANLVATAGSGQVSLTWTGSAGATSYTVKRSTSATGPFAALSAGTGLTATSFTDTGLTNGVTYSYVVMASNATGDSPDSAVKSATPVAAVVIPAAPTNLAATAGNAQVGLTWTASSGAASYTVKRSTTSGSGYTALSAGTGLATTSFTDSTALNGTTYFYVVTAVNSSGESANSNQASATPAAAVTGTPAVSLSSTSLAFQNTKVGTNSVLSVTLTNTGTAALTFTAADTAIAGTDAAQFTVTGDSCTSKSIAPRGTCTITVTFAPAVRAPAVTLRATLTITDTAGKQTVALSGKGI